MIARKDHKKALIEQGLYVESDALGTLHLQLPVVEDASQLPAQDVIFICVKADQLTEALENIKPIVTDGTILVPIMNGAEHKTWLRRILPVGRIVDTALYINSEMDEHYGIHERGKVVRLYIGGDDEEAVTAVHNLFIHPGFRCYETLDIRLETWEKYIFNCALNLITAYYGKPLGSVLAEPESKNLIQGLLAESAAVAGAMGVILPNDLKRAHFERITQKKTEWRRPLFPGISSWGEPVNWNCFPDFLLIWLKICSSCPCDQK